MTDGNGEEADKLSADTAEDKELLNSIFRAVYGLAMTQLRRN